MAKKSKFLSWFGLGKKDEQAKQQEQQAQLEAERQAQEQAAEEEARLEAERQAQEQAAEEEARLEAERQAQAQAAEAARIEAERQAQEQAAEAARIEAERQAQEQAAEAARIEAERQAQEQAAEAARIEAERQAQEQAAEEEARLEAERQAQEQAAEAARIEAERQAQEQAAEEARLEAERHAQEQAAEAARIEAERQAQEQAAEAARIEAERQAQEQAAEAARLEAERQAQEQAAEEARLEAERHAQEQAAEAARIEAERQAQEAEVAQSEEKQEAPKKSGFFSRLKQGLLKTKSNIGSGFASLFVGKKIDDELFEELETQLLTADVGVDTTVKLIDSLTDAADRKQLKDGDALYDLLKQEMADMLASAEQPLEINKKDGPFVILMVGVNGVGKTTTIGKLAKQYQQEGKSVMLAAGDTFRAAAVEQLQVWGERNNIPVIAQHTGADSASVVFDAFQAAKARNVDVLIADTAGRLQNKDNLMQELEKIARVMKKLDPQAPHEVMLTIDAGTGQNAISQVNLFDKAVGLTGITLTKLDGTAKGGVIFAIADKFKTPIRYIGVGEGIDDLRTFKSDDFIEALFSGEQ
ncbi:signal recognition particle-docking protein FtsY [Pseudoalteromonas pernae]|uniref:signal recognition particle-docking protein FtsY n=1 Tax=Pseudoalteromonas pernae TaxID=3118054 RepID=UPI003242B011